MIDTMQNIFKKAIEENQGLHFTLYTKKTKKNQEHNDAIMDIFSILDGTNFGFTCTGKTNNTATLYIDPDAVKYIYNYMESKEEGDQNEYANK